MTTATGNIWISTRNRSGESVYVIVEERKTATGAFIAVDRKIYQSFEAATSYMNELKA